MKRLDAHAYNMLELASLVGRGIEERARFPIPIKVAGL
jgi:hypothetical protein